MPARNAISSALARWTCHRLWLPCWATLGVAVRLLLVAKLGATLSFFDEQDYDRIGQSLASGGGFANAGVVTAFRPPGEPALLALVYLVVGHRPVVAEVLHAIALGCIPFAIARFGRRLGLTPGWAGSAGALAAMHPGLAYASATLYPTALTAVTLTLGLMFSLEAIEEGRRGRAMLAGAMLGLAGALTTTFVPLPVLVAAAAAIKRKGAVAVAIAVIGMAPAAAWVARNDLAVGAPVLATNGAYNLALGANDDATPRSGNWVEARLPPSYVDRGEVDRDRQFKVVAMSWIAEHPARYLGLALGRALATLDSVGRPKTTGEHDSLLARLVGYAMLPWVALGVVGLALERRRAGAWIAAAAMACVVAASAMTIAKPRFRFPCDPILSVFFAAAASAAGMRRSRRAGRNAPDRT